MANADAQVTAIATHVVRSQHASSQEPFVLGPFDQLGHFATPISAVWVYESSADLIPLERLRTAICRLLDYYPHLTGRLRIDKGTGVRSIDELGAGMHLVEARCSNSFQSFAGGKSTSDQTMNVYDLPGLGNPLLAPWDMSLEGAQKGPVFTIQRTQFACSAVSVGIRLSHVVTDAGGFLRLYQDLTEIYRRGDRENAGELITLPVPPHLDSFMKRSMLQIEDEEKAEALKYTPASWSLRDIPDTTMSSDESTQFQQDADQDSVVGRNLKFPPTALTHLKRLAVDPNDAQSRVSAFTALTAHLWQRIHRARLANASESDRSRDYAMSMYGTSVDFSPHLGLPERSFGNTILSSLMELDSNLLENAPLWEIASAINCLVRHVSKEETRKLGDWIAAQPQKSRIQLDLKITPSTFIATSWHRFPLFAKAEFEVAPSFATPVPPEQLFDGLVLFVESRAMDGGIEALTSMRESTWAALNEDQEFITNWDCLE